jgi:hypothetical protein
LIVLASLAGILFAALWSCLAIWQRRQVEQQLLGCMENLRGIGAACQSYAEKNSGKMPATLQALVAEGSLQSLPHCPAADADTYSPGYRTSVPVPDSKVVLRYSICCQGGYHPGQRRNFPECNNLAGAYSRGE